MKKRIIIALVAMLVGGSIYAQTQHYTFNYHDYQHQMTAIVQVNIDGVEQTSSDIELGAFDGETVTGSERIGVYGSAGYHRVYLAVFFKQAYDVSFKIYNHQTGVELDNFDVTFEGEPFTMACVSDAAYGLRKNPIVINFVTTQTFTKPIAAYEDEKDHYYLIASPVESVTPTEANGFLTNDFDLYYFDESKQTEEWRNYEVDGQAFDLVSGKGYLYANSAGTTLTFSGTPYTGNGKVNLAYTSGKTFAGWNLIGNPFATAATVDMPYYRLNADGSEVLNETEETNVDVMEGVFVCSDGTTTEAQFTVASAKGTTGQVAKVNINVMDGKTLIDRAIVRFDAGRTLPKFQLKEGNTKVFIPQEGKDYAIVAAEGSVGEIPVSFKAESNGSYTLSFTNSEVTFSYLHLIDNMTGNDVDLLATPSYTFDARTTDYASRFRLVFSTGASNGSDSFAFINANGEIVFTDADALGATLQIVDVMGRVLVSTDVARNVSTNGLTAGVYVLRLVNGDNVKTQKIVVR